MTLTFYCLFGTLGLLDFGIIFMSHLSFRLGKLEEYEMALKILIFSEFLSSFFWLFSPVECIFWVSLWESFLVLYQTLYESIKYVMLVPRVLCEACPQHKCNTHITFFLFFLCSVLSGNLNTLMSGQHFHEWNGTHVPNFDFESPSRGKIVFRMSTIWW